MCISRGGVQQSHECGLWNGVPRVYRREPGDQGVNLAFACSLTVSQSLTDVESTPEDNDNLTNMTMLPAVREIVGKFEVSYNQALLEARHRRCCPAQYCD